MVEILVSNTPAAPVPAFKFSELAETECLADIHDIHQPARVARLCRKVEVDGGTKREGSESTISVMSKGQRERRAQNLDQGEILFIESEVSVRTVEALGEKTWSACGCPLH